MMTEMDVERIVAQSVERAIERAADRAADAALRRVFVNLGLDIENPDHLTTWHADRIWTRQAREGSNRVKLAVKTSVIGSVLTALLFAAWNLFQNSQN